MISADDTSIPLQDLTGYKAIFVMVIGMLLIEVGRWLSAGMMDSGRRNYRCGVDCHEEISEGKSDTNVSRSKGR